MQSKSFFEFNERTVSKSHRDSEQNDKHHLLIRNKFNSTFSNTFASFRQIGKDQCLSYFQMFNLCEDEKICHTCFPIGIVFNGIVDDTSI